MLADKDAPGIVAALAPVAFLRATPPFDALPDEAYAAAAALQGVAYATAMAISAPLASAGGVQTAVPMIAVMAAGAALAVGSLAYTGRPDGITPMRPQ